MYHLSRNEFDLVLKIKSENHGLERRDVLIMLDLIGSEQFYPLEIDCDETVLSIMGFVTIEAAEKLAYSYNDPYSDFVIFITNILNSDEKNDVYNFQDIKIRLIN